MASWFYWNYISERLLTRFLSFLSFLSWGRCPDPWLNKVNMCVLVTCKAYSFSDKHVTVGWKKKERDRKGREKLFLPTVGIFPLCCTKSYCVWREGKMRNTWAVKGFFHGNLLLCMHFSSTLFIRKNAACLSIVPSILILCDKGADIKSDQEQCRQPCFLSIYLLGGVCTHTHTHTSFFTDRSYH